ncbi:MAG: GntR family transcriptional regulator [Curvibacter sp.]|nr:GntR family transcriptional regulator [Curvibacter sp.]
MDLQQAAQELTALQLHVVREVVAHVRRAHLRAGEHVAESTLAEALGTSRTPVNTALRFLTSAGVLAHDLNRGYFLKLGAAELGEVAADLASQPDDPLYLRIASDRLARQLPDLNTEAELMRLYDCSRAALRKALSRIQQEGWVEKAIGHGWEFQPMIDSAEAYEESYTFRLALEPTGILAASFRPDPAELRALLQRQRLIAESGYESMTAIELFEANKEFHETLARWSGNRFILQSIRRVDQLRRLVEYRQAQHRKPRRNHALEHIAILEALAAHDFLQAAGLMRNHLEDARRSKVASQGVFSSLAN